MIRNAALLLLAMPGLGLAEPRVAVLGDSLDGARARYAATTSVPRSDCDPVGDGRWVCASFQDPILSDVGAAPVPGDAALYRTGDLVVLNYDSAPDPDDLHAAVAARMVLDRFGLTVGRDYIVNNGTMGDLLPRSDYIEQSPRVFRALYGEQGAIDTWHDAFGDEPAAVTATAERIAATLAQGRRVWIMEGGPSDFTFEVLERLRAQGLSAGLKRITVVQHSTGFNEWKADPAHLAAVRALAAYLVIPNGNQADNGSAQLHQSHIDRDRFRTPDEALVARFRTDRVYGAAWRAAFEVLDPQRRFDGSDTVELLWILGLRQRQVADWYDFADRFLSAPVPDAPAPPAR